MWHNKLKTSLCDLISLSLSLSNDPYWCPVYGFIMYPFNSLLWISKNHYWYFSSLTQCSNTGFVFLQQFNTRNFGYLEVFVGYMQKTIHLPHISTSDAYKSHCQPWQCVYQLHFFSLCVYVCVCDPGKRWSWRHLLNNNFHRNSFKYFAGCSHARRLYKFFSWGQNQGRGRRWLWPERRGPDVSGLHFFRCCHKTFPGVVQFK